MTHKLQMTNKKSRCSMRNMANILHIKFLVKYKNVWSNISALTKKFGERNSWSTQLSQSSYWLGKRRRMAISPTIHENLLLKHKWNMHRAKITINSFPTRNFCVGDAEFIFSSTPGHYCLFQYKLFGLCYCALSHKSYHHMFINT